MKKLAGPFIVLSLALGSLGGCIVHTQSRGSARSGCGPAHHWEGGRCVHNGNGRGNGNGKGGVVVRDHRH